MILSINDVPRRIGRSKYPSSFAGPDAGGISFDSIVDMPSREASMGISVKATNREATIANVTVSA